MPHQEIKRSPYLAFHHREKRIRITDGKGAGEEVETDGALLSAVLFDLA
jgi:hypothetical protein